MKCYSTHKAAHKMAYSLALFFVIIGIIFIPALFFARFIIGRNIVTLCINGDELIVNKKTYQQETYKISQFKELALISITPANERTPGLRYGGSQATGRAIGNLLSAIVQQAGTNTYVDQQLAIKLQDDRILTFNSNYIDNSIEMIETLSQKSGLKPLEISTKEYRAWKKGKLAQFRDNPYPKTAAFLKRIEPYYKAKYLLYFPLIVFMLMLITINIWFNWTHYHIKKQTLDSLDNRYFIAKNQVENKDGDKFVDIFTVAGKKLLSHVLIHEHRFGVDESDTVFHYAFYPYDNPFYLSRILNLDNDPEPELLIGPENSSFFQVYDFNPQKNSFDIKPLDLFSPHLKWYVQELKGGKRISSFIGETIPAFAIVFYLLPLLLVIHPMVLGMKRSCHS